MYDVDKIQFINKIEVTYSESDLGLHGKAFVSEIFAFYHLLKYARGRPGRRGYVNLCHKFVVFWLFFCLFFDVIESYKSLLGFLRFFENN